MYKDLLIGKNYWKCTHPTELPCREAHPKCFNISDICTYKLDIFGYLIPCRIGSHLQNCQEFECNINFKCPGYYCISWSYVCDGKWDCPLGYDEIKLHNCGGSRTCKRMFRCKHSELCLHIRECKRIG